VTLPLAAAGLGAAALVPAPAQAAATTTTYTGGEQAYSVPARVIPAAPALADTLPASQTFGYNGTYQYLTVPAGVHQVHLTAWGGSGGSGGAPGASGGLYAAPGGLGALINLDAPVSPGDLLVIEVGAKGGDASGTTAGAGGYASGTGNEGGPGGNVNGKTASTPGTAGTAGGGGGAATTVIDPFASSTPLLIAAGGGGGGGDGELPGYNGGQGGDGGTSVNSSCDPVYGPGEFGNGATGGAGGSCGDPQAGPGGISGEGEALLSNAGTGGGGGGGLNGGDGGADGGAQGGGAGGGGAGSSFWSPVATNAVIANGGPGDGGVTVSWYATAPAGITKTVTYTGAPQEFTVPAGVDQLAITGSGGSGGFGGGSANGFIAPRGGLGAVVSEVVPVSPGDVLLVGPGAAGGNGQFFSGGIRLDPIIGGRGGLGGGSVDSGAGGGSGGSVTVENSGAGYQGGTGGGGGGATIVLSVTHLSTLLEAGGGGGGGGDAQTTAGSNGGPGGNAGSPMISHNAGDGAGLYGSGLSVLSESNGMPGAYAAAGVSAGQSAPDSTAGSDAGTGGGGGGGALGGGAGQLCTAVSGLGAGPCGGSGGGGGAGSSGWPGTAQQVQFGNSLGGGGAVTISWVQPSSQTITFTSTPPAHPVHGGSYTPAATGGASGNPVVFSIDPASSAGACALAGSTVSFTGVGTCTIAANQAGGDGYQAAPQVQQTLQIAKASQTITFTSTPPAHPVHGSSYTPAAAGGGSGNPVVFSIDSSSAAGVCSLNSAGTTVSFTGAGKCLIDANQAGNADYDPAPQEQQSFTVVLPPSAHISSPKGGRTFTLGQHVTTSFSCAEGTDGPGIASCADSGGRKAPSGVLNTSKTGTFTYTVIATSKDGQTASTSIKYTVRPRRR
jgi:trimeric autotransporter adhesin